MLGGSGGADGLRNGGVLASVACGVNGGRLRIGGGGGVPGGRADGERGVTPGRGGKETGRGAAVGAIWVDTEGAGSAAVPASFSLSSADPRSSPMEAL